MNTTTDTIKVANIIEEGRYGGPQNRIVAVAERLKKCNIETIVILPEKNKGTFAERLQDANIPFKALPLSLLERSLKGMMKFFLSFPTDVLKIRKALKENGAQLVHCNGSWQWKGVVAGKLLGLPVAWHLNDTSMPNSIHRFFNLFARWGATAFIVAAKRVEIYYLGNKFPFRPRFLVPAPVDCRQYAPSGEEHRDVSNDRPIHVACTGNINPTKDVETYIRMAKRVKDRTPYEVSFVQIGAEFESQQEYIQRVRQLNQNDHGEVVHLLGQQKDVLSFLQRADIYVCSSRFEASPISVWEAMAVGLPIVATDVGDIAAMNEIGDFARVVPTGDDEALAAAVLELIDSPEERHRLGENARKYALQHLDIEVCARNHANAYKSILSSLNS